LKRAPKKAKVQMASAFVGADAREPLASLILPMDFLLFFLFIFFLRLSQSIDKA
jgi:hypothetical protein